MQIAQCGNVITGRITNQKSTTIFGIRDVRHCHINIFLIRYFSSLGSGHFHFIFWVEIVLNVYIAFDISMVCALISRLYYSPRGHGGHGVFKGDFFRSIWFIS